MSSYDESKVSTDCIGQRECGPGKQLEYSDSTQRQKPVASCALIALVIAGVTWVPEAQRPSHVQQHRRLSAPHSQQRKKQQPSRLLSLSSVFNVIVGDYEDSTNPDNAVLAEGINNEEDFAFQSDENDQCPGQSTSERGKGLFYDEIPRIWTSDLGGFGFDEFSKDGSFQRTFMVEPNITFLEGGTGVVFNVEAVPEALPEHAYKDRLSQKDILAALQEEVVEFYESDAEEIVETTSKARSGESLTTSIGSKSRYATDQTIEVASRMPISPGKASVAKESVVGGSSPGTIFAGGQGFLAACMTAFAYHLPLALTPDDIWTVITQGFARHISNNAEELRSNFVDHDGQKEIRIRQDQMKKGESPPEDWEKLIFPMFSVEIAQNVNNTAMLETLLLRNFSTSTPASQAASEITLMATMKSYFKFQMDTMCGIPNIHLDGTRADWEALRERTKSLADWMLQNNTHGDLWIYDIVLPILDEFLHSYDGKPDYCFWQNMVKFRKSGDGSGSFDFLSGWLPTLFPYLSGNGGIERPNPFLRHWLVSASAQHMGPRPTEIPIQLASTPVVWVHMGEHIPLHFHAGFRGVMQEEDSTIRPVIGWYVTRDPEQS